MNVNHGLCRLYKKYVGDSLYRSFHIFLIMITINKWLFYEITVDRLFKMKNRPLIEAYKILLVLELKVSLIKPYLTKLSLQQLMICSMQNILFCKYILFRCCFFSTISYISFPQLFYFWLTPKKFNLVKYSCMMAVYLLFKLIHIAVMHLY